MEEIPTQWNEAKVIILFKKGDVEDEAKVIILFKKGDVEDINNYRTVSLLPRIYKVFTRVLLARIEIQLDENQPREQAGFRAGFELQITFTL